MVTKKKTAKKRMKKKAVEKKVAKSGAPISKQNFETFKFGVERLKELKKELASLDTRGFAKEEQNIRAKLKNVSEIPNIEKEIKILRLKIDKKYKPARKRKSPTKEIKEGLEDIQEDIKDLKKVHTKKKLVMDSGVDVLVDTNFNNFLNEMKSALSERVRTREKEIDKTLKEDLQKRAFNFKKKHENLLKDFADKKERLEKEYQKKYNLKLESSLHREVAERFNKLLKEKLAKEKVELGRVYKSELRQHALEELGKQKEAMTDRLERDRERFEFHKEEERKNIREKLLNEFHKKVEEEVSKKEQILRKRIGNEFDLRLKKQIQEHEEEIKKRKLDLELEMQKKIKQVLS